MEALLVAVAIILAVVVLFVLAPLWRGTKGDGSDLNDLSPRIAEMDAAKQAKLSEIREAEMDFRSHKLSEADYRAIDGELRREALAILERLDELKAAKDRRGPSP